MCMHMYVYACCGPLKLTWRVFLFLFTTNHHLYGSRLPTHSVAYTGPGALKLFPNVALHNKATHPRSNIDMISSDAAKNLFDSYRREAGRRSVAQILGDQTQVRTFWPYTY